MTQDPFMTMREERDRFRAGLQTIVDAGAVHGGAWCVAQARGYLDDLDFDQYQETGKVGLTQYQAERTASSLLFADAEFFACLTDRDRTRILYWLNNDDASEITFNDLVSDLQSGRRRASDGALI